MPGERLRRQRLWSWIPITPSGFVITGEDQAVEALEHLLWIRDLAQPGDAGLPSSIGGMDLVPPGLLAGAVHPPGMQTLHPPSPEACGHLANGKGTVNIKCRIGRGGSNS